MKRLLRHEICRVGLVLMVLFALSCAAPPKKPTEPQLPPRVVKDPFSIFLEECRNRAITYETNGELVKALQSWQILVSFIPADEEAAKRITTLKTEIVRSADEHFKQGLSFYQRNSVEAARKEFLIALHYNPDHKEALNYLKDKLPGEDYVVYRAKGGETLKEIAKKTFNDPNKDFLIAYFNDLRIDTKPAPGSTLRLPILESSVAKASIDTKETATEAKEILTDTEKMLSKALAYYKAKNYKETVSISEKVLEYDPANKQAHNLINESYYQTGKLFIQRKKYRQALEIFDHVDSGYKDVRESIAFAKKQLAGEHYLRGVKYFTDEELDKAIKEWEVTLALDPNHPKAKKDIDNARTLLQKLKEIK